MKVTGEDGKQKPSFYLSLFRHKWNKKTDFKKDAYM